MARRPHMALDPANFSLSIAILLLVGVEGSLGAEIVKRTADTVVWTAAGTILALVVGLGFALSESIQRWLRRSRRFHILQISKGVTRARALVVFVSMGAGRSSARDAAFYHAGNRVLEHLWLLTSAAAQADAEWVRSEVQRECPGADVHPTICLSDIYSIVESKEEVEKIRRQMLRKGLVSCL